VDEKNSTITPTLQPGAPPCARDGRKKRRQKRRRASPLRRGFHLQIQLLVFEIRNLPTLIRASIRFRVKPGQIGKPSISSIFLPESFIPDPFFLFSTCNACDPCVLDLEATELAIVDQWMGSWVVTEQNVQKLRKTSWGNGSGGYSHRAACWLPGW
jgi:hypothetical protein